MDGKASENFTFYFSCHLKACEFNVQGHGTDIAWRNAAIASFCSEDEPMKTFQIAIAAAALAALMAPGRADAIVLLDQENPGPVQGNVGYDAGLARGQSFTVGITGTLAEVQFFMDKSLSTATGYATLTVFDTVGGAPGTALGSVQVPASAVPDGFHAYVGFDVSSLGIAVTAGDMLFAAITDSDFFGGIYSTSAFPDKYPAGAEFGCGPGYGIACWTEQDNGVVDLMFRTYVAAAPVPATLALVLPGLALIAARRRRRTR
jgi:hypothetical protein